MSSSTLSAGLHKIHDGDLLSVPGFSGAGVSCGIKPEGALDLALIDAGREMVASAMFTRNRLPAAPVRLCKTRLEQNPLVRAVAINSGNANAMTGLNGQSAALQMLADLETNVGAPGFVMSTGVIGVPFPLEKVSRGIATFGSALTPTAGKDIVWAIMTTDTRVKATAYSFQAETDHGLRSYTVGAMAKGSGMIHPNMATMLSVIATDAPVGLEASRKMLKTAVDGSFHRISVDGDTSTNDTVLLLSEQDQTSHLTAAGMATVEEAVTQCARDMAKAIIDDGEGVGRVAHITVSGAASDAEAREVAQAIALSSLVKTALAGADPNWGRILAAMANTQANFAEERLALSLGGIRVFMDGTPLVVEQASVDRAFSQKEVAIDLALGVGEGQAEMYTTDLTHDYVTINSQYTT